MKTIGAGLGHGVYDTAGRLPEFGAVVTGTDFELLNGVLAVNVGYGGAAPRFREESLIIVGAVDVVVVVETGNTAVRD
jgi:hypothetical protein